MSTEKALDSCIGDVDGVLRVDGEDDLVGSPFMLDILLLELDLLKGGGARRDGEGALAGGRDIARPLDEPGVRKGSVAALLRPRPLVLEEEPELPVPPTKPYLEEE